MRLMRGLFGIGVIYGIRKAFKSERMNGFLNARAEKNDRVTAAGAANAGPITPKKLEATSTENRIQGG